MGAGIGSLWPAPAPDGAAVALEVAAVPSSCSGRVGWKLEGVVGLLVFYF